MTDAKDKIPVQRDRFEAWYYEQENHSLRAERMAMSYAEAQAAFDAGWNAAQQGEPVAWDVWVPPDSGYLIDSLDDNQYINDMTNIEGVETTPLYAAPPAQIATERNFCERCGKRLGYLDSIHTCTPPTSKAQNELA